VFSDQGLLRRVRLADGEVRSLRGVTAAGEAPHVAFVLEGVPGVVDVYALDDVGRFIGDLRFAVKLEHGGGHLAAAHFARLRVLSHDECLTVLLFEVGLPPVLRECATRLALSAAEREAAFTRVPEASAALPQEVFPQRRPWTRVVGSRG